MYAVSLEYPSKTNLQGVYWEYVHEYVVQIQHFQNGEVSNNE